MMLISNKTEGSISHPTYNHPVFWSGRKVFMGYSGWVWSHAWGNHVERENVIRRIYEGHPAAKKLIHQYGIDVIVVGEQEKRKYKINETFLQQIGKLIFQKANMYQIYRVVDAR